MGGRGTSEVSPPPPSKKISSCAHGHTVVCKLLAGLAKDSESQSWRDKLTLGHGYTVVPATQKK